jgi:hypothetical protein
MQTYKELMLTTVTTKWKPGDSHGATPGQLAVTVSEIIREHIKSAIICCSTRLLARRASRRPGTSIEQKMDAQILGKKVNYFQ